MDLPDGLRDRLLPLCEDRFLPLGFTQKMEALQALEALLETGTRERAPSLESRPIALQWDCPSASCLRDGLLATRHPPAPRAPVAVSGPVGRFPRCLAPRLLEAVRTDPFPRVRRAAVRVMVRIETWAPPDSSIEGSLPGPGPQDACIEDYLPGLVSRDPVSACAVLLFVVRRFGPGALQRIIAYVDAQGCGFPPVMLRLLDGLCEEGLHGADLYRVRMQLRGCCPGDRVGRGHGESRVAADPGGGLWLDCVRGARSGRDPGGRAAGEELPGPETDRAAGERFERIRRLQADKAAGERFARVRRRGGSTARVDR